MTHTPGPWSFDSDTDGAHAIWGDYKLLAVTDGWERGNAFPRSREEDEANARLIAAAPDLLKQLKKFREKTRSFLGGKDWDKELLNGVDAVIAKATEVA